MFPESFLLVLISIPASLNPFRKVMAGPCPQGPASPFIRRNGHRRISSDDTLASVPSMRQRQDSPTREAQ